MLKEYRAYLRKENFGVTGGPQTELRRLGAPEDIIDGSRFERLAAEKRAGRVPVQQMNDAATDASNRARAAALGKQIDDENIRRAAELAKII